MNESMELGKQIDQLIKEMETVSIMTDEQFTFMAEWLKKLKATQKIVLEVYDPQIKELYEPYKTKLAEKKTYTDRLDAAERAAKSKMSAYQAIQERKRLEEKQRLEEEARKAEAEKLLNEAIKKNDETVLERPIVIPSVYVGPATTKVSGISFVETWDFVIENMELIPRDYMLPDEKKIRQAVKLLKDKAVIPGVKVFARKDVRASA